MGLLSSLRVQAEGFTGKAVLLIVGIKAAGAMYFRYATRRRDALALKPVPVASIQD
jgi:hypothetical protein